MTDGVTVADLVEAGAARSPGAVAVVAGTDSLTYAELDARANRLAHHLRDLGVGPDVTVGVFLDRSTALAVALQAVLKAGGACVPLDPSYPPERLAFMAGDAAVAAVVTRAGLAGRLPATGAPVVRLDADGAQWAHRPATPPPRASDPEHGAYVIYTSGSTGRPKGVLLAHRGLVNHHRAAVELYRLGPGDRVLQFCSLGFDASIEELFPTWASGATVVFRPDDAPLLGRRWLGWLGREAVTVLNLPTAYWHQWVRDLEALGEPVPTAVRLVVVGGEKALGPAYRSWLRSSGARSRWVNAYGPTETTCMSTVYEPPPAADPGEGWHPPIGRPLPGTTVVVVDEAGRPVPLGDSGELLIGGAGLARGYLNAPDLTAERFVAGPDGHRAYRTGDVVRLLPGGDLDYVGRVDDQVKVRGFRVECGEVEAALALHPGVAEAAVVPRRHSGGTRLVAYAAGAGGEALTATGLRRFLAERLPDHMVPSAFVVLEALPLTPNGKVDRDGLPVPGAGSAAVDRSASAPRSAAEEAMAAIWARVLGLDPEQVGADDDFFELGGHSLLATQVMAEVQEEFGTDTPLRAIFEAPTVAALTAAVEADRGGHGAGPALERRTRQAGEKVPLSLAQEQMWALEAAADPPGLFNITALHRFDEPVDEDALRSALGHLVDRHEVLRTAFVEEGGRVWQVVAPAAAVDLATDDLTTRPAAEREDQLALRIAREDARPFDPARPPLVRARLFHLDGKSAQLTVTFDHLVADGTGVSAFMAELGAVYEAMAAHRPPALPPLPVQYADFARWQRAHVTEEVLARQLAWWARALEGAPVGPVVPFDRVPARPTRRIASRPVTLGAGTRRLLDDLARATGSTVFTVTVAGVLAVLGRVGGTTDVMVSTTLSGRRRVEVEDLVGQFSGIGRVRADLSGDPTFTEVVARTRDFVLGMFENQDIPFLRVRRALLPDFPAGGVAAASAVPVDFQFFQVGRDPWVPGRPASGGASGQAWRDDEFFFRGQLHPLSVVLVDDGAEVAGELSYKVDFYDAATVDRLGASVERVLDAVGHDPALPLSELPVIPSSPL